mgnify:CR=1 FL=1
MKISEAQKKERLRQAQAEAEQKEQDHLMWLKDQNFLNKDNREYLVNELIDLQQEEARQWSNIHRDSDKNIPNWKHHKDRMYFKIDILNLKIDKIKQVLINNKFK